MIDLVISETILLVDVWQYSYFRTIYKTIHNKELITIMTNEIKMFITVVTEELAAPGSLENVF